jgi:cytochrome P450
MMNLDFTAIPPEGSPFAELERVRVHGPIFWSDTLHGWVVSGYDDVKKVLSDSANFTSENSPLSAAFGSEAMLVIDTPMHHKIRNVWAKPASVSGVAATTEVMEVVVKGIVDQLAERLKAGEEVDLPPLLEAFVSEMITSLMGIDRKYKDPLLNWNRVISDLATIPLEESDARYAQRAEAKEGVFDLLRAEIADRIERFERGEEPQDLISLMVAAEGRDGITASIVLNNALNLVLGALDTTVRWTGNALAVLHRYPDLLAEIRADRSLLPQAIEEVMRFETIVQVTSRVVRADGVTMCGQALKQGDLIYVLPGAANRDPAIFEHPGELDIRRKPKLHLGFGFGMHLCLGMNIARKEALTFINALFDAVPNLEIVECDYGPSWSLWGPLKLVVRAS